MNPQNFVVPSSENHPLSPPLGDHGSAFCAFPRYAFSRVVGEAVAQSFVLLSGISIVFGLFTTGATKAAINVSVQVFWWIYCISHG